MTFLQRLLLPKVAGAIGGVMLMAIVALGLALSVTANRLKSTTNQLMDAREVASLWKDAAHNYRASNQAKDGLLKKQTDSIKALKEKSDAETALYRRLVADSRRKSAAYQAEAGELLRLDLGTADEITQCRAARALLERELVELGER